MNSNTFTSTPQPTASIRFKERSDGRRILQQLWWIVTLENPGIIVKQRGEWRDVECVGPDSPDTE